MKQANHLVDFTVVVAPMHLFLGGLVVFLLVNLVMSSRMIEQQRTHIERVALLSSQSRVVNNLALRAKLQSQDGSMEASEHLMYSLSQFEITKDAMRELSSTYGPYGGDAESDARLFEAMEDYQRYYSGDFLARSATPAVAQMASLLGSLKRYEYRESLRLIARSERFRVVASLMVFLATLFAYFFMRRRLNALETGTRQLRGNHQQLDSLFEGSPVMLYSMGSDGEITAMNQQMLDSLGYRREELIGTPIARLFNEEQLRLLREVSVGPYHRDIVRSGMVKHLQLELVCSNGTPLAVSVTAKGVYDSNGMLVGMVGICLESMQQDVVKALMPARCEDTDSDLESGVDDQSSASTNSEPAHLERA